MQTTPAPVPAPELRFDRSRAAWALVIVACSAITAALVLIVLSLALGNAANVANPLCVTPRGHLAEMTTALTTEWLFCGVAIVLAGACALIARWIAPSSAAPIARVARVALVVTALALVGLVCSFSWYYLIAAGHCIG